jgi:hypothetical protein
MIGTTGEAKKKTSPREEKRLVYGNYWSILRYLDEAPGDKANLKKRLDDFGTNLIGWFYDKQGGIVFSSNDEVKNKYDEIRRLIQQGVGSF